MADLTFFQESFNNLADNCVIGNPQGRLGFAYLRVSSTGQAEEGRSGLPRQIARIHEVSLKENIAIPWNMVFADDHTGFEFRDRPALNKLRNAYTNPNRLADVVVMEYLDRLSRNADWHQGFLLDEMKQHNIEALFWKGFSSHIERAVMGAISQDGMERELQNMREGTLNKARSGRVTAKTPNYGYIFVDADGKESAKIKKETYYAPHPEQSEIVKLIYHKIGVEGMTATALAPYLQYRFPPPGRYKKWIIRQICLFIQNPVYKGQFICNRWEHTKVPAKHQRPGEPIRMASTKIERPEGEWIIVPVPPLVSEELWQAANDILTKNAHMARRNGKYRYLLTGIIHCSHCGFSYSGTCKTYHRKDGGKSYYRSYRCLGRDHRTYIVSTEVSCKRGSVNANVLENVVWHSICQVLLEPERLITQLEAVLDAGENSSLEKQVGYINKQISSLANEDEKLYRAYIADVFDEKEFAARRQLLKQREIILQQELEEIQNRQVSKAQMEQDKGVILKLAETLRAKEVAIDAPFELKNHIIRMLVECVLIDTEKQQIELKGHIKGVFPL